MKLSVGPGAARPILTGRGPWALFLEGRAVPGRMNRRSMKVSSRHRSAGGVYRWRLGNGIWR